MKFKVILAIFGIFLLAGCEAVEVVEEPIAEPVVEAEAASEPVEAKEIVLAKCMTASGAKLYTASWCGHCQNQKEAFGEGLQYLDNIECAAFGGWAQECTDAGVKAVPTWIFGDGTTRSGNTPLATLASLTNCTY